MRATECKGFSLKRQFRTFEIINIVIFFELNAYKSNHFKFILNLYRHSGRYAILRQYSKNIFPKKTQ